MSFPRPADATKILNYFGKYQKEMSSNSRRRRHGVDDPRRMMSRNYSLSWGAVPSSVAPYVPTPIRIVRKMLELAGAGADDTVYDLGCGDGRILFTAVEEFDVRRAVGYELNPTMCESMQRKVEGKGLQGRIEVVNGNFFLADLSPASLVTLYLTTSGNSKLRPKFEKELRGGARIVSHDFPVQGWTTLKKGAPPHNAVGSHRIYLYRVPDSYETRRKTLWSPGEGSRWRRFREVLHRLEGRR